MKLRIRSVLTFIIGWPLSFIAIFFILKLMIPHTSELGTQLATINYWFILLGVICFIIYYFLRSYIYQLILKYLGYSLSLRDSAFYWSQSELHRYIPGNIWSFLGRTVLFSKKSVDKKDIATSLIVETQLVLIGTLIVTLVGIPYLINSFLPHIPFHEYYLPAFVVLGFLATLLYIYSGTFSHLLKFRILKKLLTTEFHPSQNTTLVVVSAVSYVFFGLGYFFIMCSLFPINPQMTWELTGFFAFSLLAGYISILTPTGLGIREGIIIIGLKSVAPTAILGLASIISRAILIASEVVYLFLAFLWFRIKTPLTSNLEPFISKNRHIIFLTAAVITYCIYFTITSFLRYDHFYTGRFDLGNMAQTVWNTYHGSIFMLTNPNGVENVSRLAFHADFLLILLAPLYALWESPKMLLLIQTLVTGLGAFYVYLLSKKILKGKTLPLIIACVYLLNPSLQRANIYDFHAVTLATTFLLGAFYYLTQKKYLWLWVFLVLAALTKEQVWLIVMFFGIYMAAFQKKVVQGALLTLVGVSMFVILVFYAIPQSAHSQHFALAYYSDFGDKPTDIVKNIVFSPQKTIPLFFERSRIDYYNKLFLPVGFLPLLSPIYLFFAAGDGIIGLLSSNPQLRQIYYQYTSTITPFIFIATVYGIARLFSFYPRISRKTVGIFILLLAIYAAYQYGPLPGGRESNLAMYTSQRKNSTAIDNYLAGIPQSYSVAATNNAGSHLSHRSQIYAFPSRFSEADIVVLLTDAPNIPFNKGQREIIDSLKTDQNYIIFHEEEDFYVFKRMGNHSQTK